MQTFTIILEKISTGEKAPSMVVRRETEDQARKYAEDVIFMQPFYADFRVAEIKAR